MDNLYTDASSGYNSRISALESAGGNSGFTYAGSYSTWAKLYLPENTPCSSGSRAMGKLVVNATTEKFAGVTIRIFDTNYFNIWAPYPKGSTIWFYNGTYFSIGATDGYIGIVANYSHRNQTSNINVSNGTYLFDMIRN